MSRLVVIVACAVTAFLVLAPASPAERSKNISPYKTFEFRYTKKTPGKATGLRYRVALVHQDAKAPIVERLDLTFAKGTKIALDAVDACRATDAEIQAGGPATCDVDAQIAKGTAKVFAGGDAPLTLDATVAASGKSGVVVTLSTGGNVARVLRGRLNGRTLSVPIPALEVGGTRVALVAFSLDIDGGTAKKPVFTTPKTCTAKGWDVTYAPTFADLGTRKLVDTTKCRS